MTKCIICYESFEKINKFICENKKCSADIDKNCIDKWIFKNANPRCPACRIRINVDIIDYERKLLKDKSIFAILFSVLLFTILLDYNNNILLFDRMSDNMNRITFVKGIIKMIFILILSITTIIFI